MQALSPKPAHHPSHSKGEWAPSSASETMQARAERLGPGAHLFVLVRVKSLRG